MNQGESKLVNVGGGVAILKEHSNDSKARKHPSLTIMFPGGVEDEVYSPAESITMYNQNIEQLYKLLKDYYES